MKIIFTTIILFLFFADLFGQEKKSARFQDFTNHHKATFRPLNAVRISGGDRGHALVVIDGRIFDGTSAQLSSISTGTLTLIEIIKDTASSSSINSIYVYKTKH